MSLFLTKTWEHALVARVVKEAADIAQRHGGYLGRTAIQKVLYFLQVRDVPMRYRFEVHHYGPFCSTILDDLEWLLADEVVLDTSPDSGKYSKYTPGPACEELLAKHSAKLKECEETVRNTVKALLPLKPEHLELIATLDYAFREVKATQRGKPEQEKVIARFREFKGNKFNEHDICTTYESLEKAGLFE